jgi:hypothetical protein
VLLLPLLLSLLLLLLLMHCNASHVVSVNSQYALS